MSGSGTVLAVAHSKGHHAVGVDLDPLAVLISRVWTTAIDVEATQCAATAVLEHARRIFASLSTRDAYPRNADSETRQFTRYWFDDYARRQLASLATAIEFTRDRTIREALWCAFSRLIITKQSGASLAMDLSHSRPHRKFRRAPAKPFRASFCPLWIGCPQIVLTARVERAALRPKCMKGMLGTSTSWTDPST